MKKSFRFEKKQTFKDSIHKLIPNIDNLYFFNEVDIFPESTSVSRSRILAHSFKNFYKYEHFLKQKGRRPLYDMYACFQPFNESLKALYPFLKKLKKQVKKEDVILNLWDRSGWLTNLLAGLFPEQQIITTWQGNKDILGYQGYHFWMKDLENVTVLFCDLNKPLPLKDKSIAFVVGLDAFHRFDQLLMMQELLRLVKNNGAILFPHVHLSNSEPEPFFERGCKQIHGKEYQSAFDLINKSTNWEGFVFSEPELFNANDITINTPFVVISNPNTKDYNALLALLPKPWKETALSSFSLKDIANPNKSRVLINILLNISLHHQKVIVDHGYFDGAMKSLLERHPVYVERIKGLEDFSLSELAIKMIYLAKRGLTVEEVSSTLNESENLVIKELEKLEKLGLLQVLPISESGIRLQNYIMSQEYIIPKREQTLKHLWESAVKSFPDNTAIISLQDESEFTYGDCNEILPRIMAVLQTEGLKKGDKIIICNTLHTEAVLLFWACIQLGIVVVPIAQHLADDAISTIVETTESEFIFTNQKFYSKKENILNNLKTILFDCEEDEQNEELIYFADWLNITTENNSKIVNIAPIDEAVILFTSGSTGTPKGVQLSHENLFRSGRLITETFHWKENDRFFALGGLEAMSGLRNSAISGLHVGSSVVIPKEDSATNLFTITEAIEVSQSTIMGSNPALLRQAIKFKDKIRGQLDSIKILICTGNKVSNQLRTDVKECYGLSILNYYGLSETTGICISQSPLDKSLDFDTIGKPIGCIAQIVDEDDNLVAVGEAGELRIFSDNLMQGYFKDPEQTQEAIKNGWFYTQDTARYIAGGYIQLLGRKRNIIKTSIEEIVYLDVIQEFISDLDFIEDTFVCSYDQDDTEKIAAFITLKSEFSTSEEAIKKNLNNLLIEKFGEKQIPNRLQVLAQLPYSPNGKLLKNKLLNELI
jgi:acyl-coenzyme A synthetase/AMP-(fatty) acid ligase